MNFFTQFHASVPILPDLLQSYSNRSQMSIPSSVMYKNFDLHYIPNTVLKHPVAGNTIKNFTKDQILQQPNVVQQYNVETENGNVGLLLAVKAFVQLFCNPIVGNFTGRFGYKNLIFFGTVNLLLSSLSELETNRTKKSNK